jgi:hypothetical protein
MGTSGDSPGHYTIRIFTADGHLQAEYSAAVGGDEIPPAMTFGRCCAVIMPAFSLSDTSVYFPDGDGELRALRPDGSTLIVHKLPNVRGHARAFFAVSPDDRRIAISVFDWSVTPMNLRIYVEDSDGSRSPQSGSPGHA